MERALRYTERTRSGRLLHATCWAAGRGCGSSAATGPAALADADEALASPGLLGMNAVLPLVVRGRIEAARGDAARHGDLGRGGAARRRRRATS